MGVKNHNGYFGCTNVRQRKGEFVENGVIFPELYSTLRTDDSFNLKKQYDNYNNETILSNLNIGLVTKYPLDYIHLICLEATLNAFAIMNTRPNRFPYKS